jgi:serine/threonine-protein kinase
MATIYFAQRIDAGAGTPMVAVKRVHPHLAHDRRFSSMFIDEARLVSRIQHPNVIRTVDIIANEDESLLVMEYVHGESLGRLLTLAEERREAPPLGILSSVLCGTLEGLHAAHTATNAAGVPLSIVHRDISPQNVLVGVDGIARVLDFGVAKAAGSVQVTRDGEVKGKLAYMSPEQLAGHTVDRRTDVYAAGVILWEAVTQRPLFDGENDGAIIAAVLRQVIPVPSSVAARVSPSLDRVIMRALATNPDDRFATALDMARALEAAIPRSDPRVVSGWVDGLAGESLRERYRVMQDPSGRGRQAARTAPPVGVTEVFFTAPPRGAPSEVPLTPLGGDDSLSGSDADTTAVDGDFDDIRTKLMAKNRRRAAVQRMWRIARWTAAGLGTLAIVGFGLWEALKPAPPVPAGITAAPDSISPAGR